jgi:hypothetical protein
MLPEWGDRQTFLPKELSYLGSFDVQSRGYHSVSEGEATLQKPDDPGSQLAPLSEATFYHVLRAATVIIGGRERDCPVGEIAYAFERLILRAVDGLVEVSGQLVLHTEDNASIDATYSGIARFFHPLSDFLALQRRNASKEAGHAFITIGFDTADQRYAWLGDRQCFAFGNMNLAQNRQNGNGPSFDLTVESSYDIYTGS